MLATFSFAVWSIVFLKQESWNEEDFRNFLPNWTHQHIVVYIIKGKTLLAVTPWVIKHLGCRRWRYSIDFCTCWGCEMRCCWRNPQTVWGSSSRTCGGTAWLVWHQHCLLILHSPVLSLTYLSLLAWTHQSVHRTPFLWFSCASAQCTEGHWAVPERKDV